MKIKRVYVIGGGTVHFIANHLAISAPAYGNTAHELSSLVSKRFKESKIVTTFTKMAGGVMETNEDVARWVEYIKKDFNTKVVFFNVALVDFVPQALSTYKYTGVDDLKHLENADEQLIYSTIHFGKYSKRLETRGVDTLTVNFYPAKKIIPNIRKGRKDIFLVGFKTTCGASKQEMFEKGLSLCKESSVNLVLVNDTKTRWNMIVTPEEAAYHETDDRNEVLKNLVDMAWYRSQLTFTQSTVVDGKPVSWNDDRVPASLRTVVNHCVNGKAYKPFNGSTVGHFAVKISDTEFLTSIRKSNFNDLEKTGLVYVKTDGSDSVLAYGAKPSVGGQSQRIVFRNHEGCDCIVHFHSPLRENHPDAIPTVSQREVECGSHQCGKNTSDNLAQFGNLKAVYLEQHGPNIVFSKQTNPQEVIDFIERNFDLTKKTGGYNI